MGKKLLNSKEQNFAFVPFQKASNMQRLDGGWVAAGFIPLITVLMIIKARSTDLLYRSVDLL